MGRHRGNVSSFWLWWRAFWGVVAGGRHRSRAPVATAPEDAVTGLLTAVDAHDCTAAEAYLTDTHRAFLANASDSFLTNVVSVTNIQQAAPSVVPTGDPAAEPYRTVHMGAVFTLQQKRIVTFLNGTTVWDSEVVQRTPGSSWLIDDEGVG